MAVAHRIIAARVGVCRVNVEVRGDDSSVVLVPDATAVHLVSGCAWQGRQHSYHEAVTAAVRVVFWLGALADSFGCFRNHLVGNTVVVVQRSPILGTFVAHRLSHWKSLFRSLRPGSLSRAFWVVRPVAPRLLFPSDR